MKIVRPYQNTLSHKYLKQQSKHLIFVIKTKIKESEAKRKDLFLVEFNDKDQEVNQRPINRSRRNRKKKKKAESTL